MQVRHILGHLFAVGLYFHIEGRLLKTKLQKSLFLWTDPHTFVSVHVLATICFLLVMESRYERIDLKDAVRTTASAVATDLDAHSPLWFIAYDLHRNRHLRIGSHKRKIY